MQTEWQEGAHCWNRTEAPHTQGTAEDALKLHIERIQHAERAGVMEPAKVITFGERFNGRFWREWVVAQKNKPTEVRSKKIIYGLHLQPRFKDTPLDEIDVSVIAQLRADLVERRAVGESR